MVISNSYVSHSQRVTAGGRAGPSPGVSGASSGRAGGGPEGPGAELFGAAGDPVVVGGWQVGQIGQIGQGWPKKNTIG